MLPVVLRYNSQKMGRTPDWLSTESVPGPFDKVNLLTDGKQSVKLTSTIHTSTDTILHKHPHKTLCLHADNLFTQLLDKFNFNK